MTQGFLRIEPDCSEFIDEEFHPWMFKVPVDWDKYGVVLGTLAAFCSMCPLLCGLLATFMRHQPKLFDEALHSVTRFILDAANKEVEFDDSHMQFTVEVMEILGEAAVSSPFLMDISRLLNTLQGSSDEDLAKKVQRRAGFIAKSCIILTNNLRTMRGTSLEEIVNFSLGKATKAYIRWVAIMLIQRAENDPAFGPAEQVQFLVKRGIIPHHMVTEFIPYCQQVEGHRQSAGGQWLMNEVELSMFYPGTGYNHPGCNTAILQCFACNQVYQKWSKMTKPQQEELGTVNSKGQIKFDYQRSQYQSLNKAYGFDPRDCHEVGWNSGDHLYKIFSHQKMIMVNFYKQKGGCKALTSAAEEAPASSGKRPAGGASGGAGTQGDAKKAKARRTSGENNRKKWGSLAKRNEDSIGKSTSEDKFEDLVHMVEDEAVRELCVQKKDEFFPPMDPLATQAGKDAAARAEQLRQDLVDAGLIPLGQVG